MQGRGMLCKDCNDLASWEAIEVCSLKLKWKKAKCSDCRQELLSKFKEQMELVADSRGLEVLDQKINAGDDTSESSRCLPITHSCSCCNCTFELFPCSKCQEKEKSCCECLCSIDGRPKAEQDYKKLGYIVMEKPLATTLPSTSSSKILKEDGAVHIIFCSCCKCHAVDTTCDHCRRLGQTCSNCACSRYTPKETVRSIVSFPERKDPEGPKYQTMCHSCSCVVSNINCEQCRTGDAEKHKTCFCVRFPSSDGTKENILDSYVVVGKEMPQDEFITENISKLGDATKRPLPVSGIFAQAYCECVNPCYCRRECRPCAECLGGKKCPGSCPCCFRSGKMCTAKIFDSCEVRDNYF